MLLHPPRHNASLLILEAGLTMVAIASAFAWPKIGDSTYSFIERAFGKLAQRKRTAIVFVGLSVLTLRLAMLPLFPIPLPFVPDDFSFLLAADTFAHGRLTNITPQMWQHFESIHITLQPTYMSMYFPGEGLLLALGQLLFHNPWFALLGADALMCASLCWMLQAWLPARWALLGGILAVLRLGLFSVWINTFHSAGSLAALGGALVLGALPRLLKTGQLRYRLTMATGVSILIITRPYEGMLLCLPLTIFLIYRLRSLEIRPSLSMICKCTALPLLLVITSISWMAFYDYRAFGSPFTLPYTIDRSTYATAPYYVWQSERATPAYRHEVMRNFYSVTELAFFHQIHTRSGFIPYTLLKVELSFLFYSSFALLPPLTMLRRVLMDRRIRPLLFTLPVLAAGMVIEIFLVPHYLAPFTAVFYAIGMQAMRHLRQWDVERQPVGLALVRMMVTVCVVMTACRLFAQELNIVPGRYPVSDWNCTWFGPGAFGTERASLLGRLQALPNRSLVIVRYSPNHDPFDEWVYNSADIPGSKVIWAREMTGPENTELIKECLGRKIWLVEPDNDPALLTPYPPEVTSTTQLAQIATR